MLATTNTGKVGRGFRKSACEWTGRVEIGKEEIPGSKCSMYGYMMEVLTVIFVKSNLRVAVL